MFKVMNDRTRPLMSIISLSIHLRPFAINKCHKSWNSWVNKQFHALESVRHFFHLTLDLATEKLPKELETWVLTHSWTFQLKFTCLAKKSKTFFWGFCSNDRWKVASHCFCRLHRHQTHHHFHGEKLRKFKPFPSRSMTLLVTWRTCLMITKPTMS